jgi:hypothetical protein
VVSIRRYLSLRALAVGCVAILAACADAGITAPDAAAPLSLASARLESGPSLLACPGLNTQSASAVIGAAGGSLSVGGQVMTVPAGAVPTPTLFTMSVPPGRYMELDIDAAGQEHYAFAKPVSITVDYSRCRGQAIPLSLAAWYIDSESKTLLENMGGVDDRSGRRLTFVTDHLSGYAIAW